MLDSELLRGIYVSEEMREIFSDDQLLQKWVNSWIALAKAEAEVGIIPKEAADEIEKNADVSKFDKVAIREGIVDTTHPLIVQIRHFTKMVGGKASGYIHWGATTQDIMDTAVVLQMKDAQILLEKQLRSLLDQLLKLAKEHESTVMPGRTHGQHALPITLGYKIAIWADEIGKHLDRLEDGKKRYLVGSLGGAAGTLASIHEDVMFNKHFVNLINNPTITWHVQRDGLAEFSSIIAMISGTIGKIANEIINLQKSEIGEIEEGFKMGQVGSSTMPHKRNPMICEYVVGLTRLVQRNASLSLMHDPRHERDMTFWTTEWSYIPQICMLTSGGIEQMTGVLNRWIVYPDNMERNLNQLQGLIVSENLMLSLGEFVGRDTAHDLIYDVSMKAFEENQPLADIAVKDSRITEHISEQEIRNLLDPKSYIGLSKTFVDRVHKRWAHRSI
ncbi:LOW QUALITY PROTEIN: adenylosuccinate lyase [Geomicrobium sp. JCM 19037]|nr:LOW QUALITY PROTEIN: adenylosuccinate lyase [Geomicrobium sp. JCM 19037]